MAENEKPSKENEAKALGVKASKVNLAGSKIKPESLDKEQSRHNRLIAKRVANRIEKAKKLAKMKPIDKRKALLIGRFRAVTSKTRAVTYSEKVIKAWTEEFEMINNNPKIWRERTGNGTRSFVPANRKKMTAKERLEHMDLGDDTGSDD